MSKVLVGDSGRGVAVGPHGFERLTWIMPRACSRCLLPKYRHPVDTYSPARDWHSRDRERRRGRRIAVLIFATLALLALLLIAALPAAGV